MTDLPSGVQRGRSSDVLSKVSRDSGPVGSSLIQMSSPEFVLSPMASRLPSGESDQPTFPFERECRRVQLESSAVIRPVRSIQVISYSVVPPLPPPTSVAIVPLALNASWGKTSKKRATLSRIGTAVPRSSSRFRSKGAARTLPSERTYARCPVGRYHPCFALRNQHRGVARFQVEHPELGLRAEVAAQREEGTPRPGKWGGEHGGASGFCRAPDDRRCSACVRDPAQGEVFTGIEQGVVVEPCRGRDEDRICQRDGRPSDDGHLLQFVVLAERDPLPVRGEHRERRASRPHERSGGVLGPLLHPELGSPVCTGAHIDQPGAVGGERHQAGRSLALREGEAVAGHRLWRLGPEPSPERGDRGDRREDGQRERRGRTSVRAPLPPAS